MEFKESQSFNLKEQEIKKTEIPEREIMPKHDEILKSAGQEKMNFDEQANRTIISNQGERAVNSDVGKKITDPQQGLTVFEKWVQKIKNQNDIGSGAEKCIFIHPEFPDKVVAVFFSTYGQSINSIKRRFYVNKILSILYPDNIPNIHLAASRPAVLVIDRVMGKETSPSPWNLKQRLYEIIIEWRLKKVGIRIDRWSSNFMADKKGRVFYVDGFSGSFGCDTKKLLKAINKLTPDERRRALNYLDRLDILGDEPPII